MKKVDKFAAAIAVALSMGVAPQANAIKFHPNGRGDALLFPVFNGYVENYFTIMNNHNEFIQGHLRFRGAAWSGELRDFDVILSPGDVFVFRVADIDGDGMWEIDQSLDLKNFQYTGLGGTPEKGGMDGWTCSPEFNPDMKIPKCMDPSDKLIPSAEALAEAMDKEVPEAQAIIDYHKHSGYIEFIGEAVLRGLDYNIMEILLGNNPGDWKRHQTTIFSKRGTNAWVWSDASNKFERDNKTQKVSGGTGQTVNGLADVPNALSGTAFITIPGIGHGLAYNAEVFADFRTGATEHRVDNYRMVSGNSLDEDAKEEVSANRAVILHHEDAASASTGTSPTGDYVSHFVEDERSDEAFLSFQNTWGPTLADGDDYDMSSVRTVNGDDDDFDKSPWQEEEVVGDDGVSRMKWVFTHHGLDHPNSIAEVEEAMRSSLSQGLSQPGAAQVFSSYYMDGDLFDKSCEGNGTEMAGSETEFCPEGPLVRSKPDEPDTVGRTTLTSHYFAFFPTKVFYGHTLHGYYDKPSTRDFVRANQDTFLVDSVARVLTLAKPLGLEVWDIFEKSDRGAPKFDSSLSPAIPAKCIGDICKSRVLGYEVNFFSIHDVKEWVDPEQETSIGNFRSGRVVITMANNDPEKMDEINWPGLMYTFEWDEDTTLAHWRAMHH